MAKSKAELRAINKWRKKNIKTFLLNLNKTSDKDVIEQLEKQPSKNGYIKELIRNDIDKNKLQNLSNK